MKTTAELQAVLEKLRPCEPRSGGANREFTIELIEEILRLREQLFPYLLAEEQAEVLQTQIELRESRDREPIQWITGKPYRNE